MNIGKTIFVLFWLQKYHGFVKLICWKQPRAFSLKAKVVI